MKLLSRLRILLPVALGLVLLDPGVPAPALHLVAAGGGWTTYHQNNARTGSDNGSSSMATLQSTVLSPALDEKVQAEPLISGGTVYAATENNTIYAFDEMSSTLALSWSKHLQAQVGYGSGGPPGPFFCEGSHLGNTGVGITGTPVIDAAGGAIYAVTLTPDPAGPFTMKYQLFAVSLATHQVVSTTDLVFSDLDPRAAGQRGALTLANGRIYIPFGGRDGDCEPYHPVVVSVPLGGGSAAEWDGQAPASGPPCDTNNCQEAGIWASGGMAADGAGNLLLATGNGPGGWNCGLGWDHGDGVVKLDPNLNEVNHFAPSSWCTMHQTDQDMGSISPVLLTPSSLLFQTAKTGQGWVLDSANLGNTTNGSTGTHVPNCNTGDAAFGSTAWDGARVYVPCDGQGVEALTVDTVNRTFSHAWFAPGFSPGPPIVAGGYVWATSQGGGTLHRLNQATGASTTFPMGAASRFNTPAADQNRIFAAQNNPSGIREWLFGSFPINYTAIFPWYDRISSPGFTNDNIHVLNPGAAPVSVTLNIPGQPGCTVNDTIAAGAAGVYSCPTGFGGPVVVQASARVDASQRVQYYQSFNEVAAVPMTAAATSLFFPWYDRISSPGFQADNIHVVVPGTVAGSVQVGIPGCPVQTQTIPGLGEGIFTCATGFGGPVTITAGVPVLASQRVQYYQTFNEIAAQPAAAAATTLFFPWYDLVSSPGFQSDNVHLVNPGSVAAQVTVSIPGCAAQSGTVAPGGELHLSCATGFGGPVKVVATGGPVLASQRVKYYDSFNETTAQAASVAATTVYLAWFDRISDPGFQADNVHLVNPGAVAAQVTVNIPGCAAQNGTVPAGGELHLTCPTGFGGPVKVVATGGPVLASQRVQYYRSFNEVSGQP